MLTLAGTALLLSALTITLPGGACFSAATPLWLWLTYPPVSLAGIGLQTCFSALKGCRGRQLILEPLSALGGLALWQIILWLAPQTPSSGQVISLIIYLGLIISLRWHWAPGGPERVAYLRMQRALRRLHLVTVIAVPCWQEPWSVCLLPLLLSTHWAAANERFRVEAQINQELQHVRQDLSAVTQQKNQLQLLLQSQQTLTACMGIQSLLQALPQVCQSIAAHHWGILSSAQGYLLLQWGNPIAKNLNSVQNLVQKAYHQATPSELDGTLALPLAGNQGWMGCLVLDSQPAFTTEQKQTLQLLSQQILSAWLRAQALEQLAQTQRQLLLSSKMIAVGGVAAGVAHELNSPLGAISLMLEGALRQLHDPDSARSKLGKATQACARAKDIVERLLHQARDPQIEDRPFRLDDCLKEALAFIEPQLQQADIQLILHWSDNYTFIGQPSSVQQVMINLLHNAAQACQNDKRILLETQPWGFRVIDWGSGISSEQAPHIFEPFFTSSQNGHGLGLWICQDLLRQQGGEIRLSSSQPTCFEVYLKSADSGKP